MSQSEHVSGSVARARALSSVEDAAALYRAEPALAPGLAGGMRVAREAVVYPPNVARHLDGHEVAKVVVHLASDDAAFTNGHVYLVDGGETAGLYDRSSPGPAPDQAPRRQI